MAQRATSLWFESLSFKLIITCFSGGVIYHAIAYSKCIRGYLKLHVTFSRKIEQTRKNGAQFLRKIERRCILLFSVIIY